MKLTIVAMSAVFLAFGIDAQAQKSVSGPTVSATQNGSSSAVVADRTPGSSLTIAPISATPGGSSSIINPTVPTANAAYVLFDISGVESWDSFGDLSNTLLTSSDGGTGSAMTGIGWDVTIATIGYRWLSEPKIYFDGSDLDGSGLFLTPGSGSGPGTATYSSDGVIDLTDVGIPNIPILADGLLHMEFYEGYDDVNDAVDAVFQAGSTLTLLYDQIGIDISGVQSWDAFGDPSNTLLTNDSGGMGSVMTGIGWDVTIATIGYSWLSEPKIYFDGSDLDGSGLFLTPGTGSGPGTGTFSSGGIIDLSDAGIPDIPVLADGLIHMEFFEGYDDVNDAADADFLATSTLTLTYATCGAVTEMTAGCPGNGGFVPTMSVTGCVTVGDAVDLNVVNMDGGAYFFLVSSFTSVPGNIVFPSGCSVDVAVNHLLFLGTTPGAGAGAGAVSYHVTLPISGTFYEQVVVVDTVAGKVTSNSLELVITP
ncbi:MAG: hypothetical protein V2A76_17095 [Planctomycetota bacterium]